MKRAMKKLLTRPMFHAVVIMVLLLVTGSAIELEFQVPPPESSTHVATYDAGYHVMVDELRDWIFWAMDRFVTKNNA
eukprot:CAMPEP_0184701270 /NCGR_PEP_ID=MMETSP0313-20130426/18975_1 /TAXON_ID=2792 /ORGANISM="Porphyridium aerugineum, Strain SAG 1380-2" /LENGTH=76 /DNA_ID=CAMNT_0027161265 /DNA_START=181 /DNA_END=411 /DNA_ORIENTATION=+